MKTFVFCWFLIFFALAGRFSCQENANRMANVGVKCERDVDCIDHAFCRWQQNCMCDPYYSPSPDKSRCIPTVGLSCLDNSACQGIMNAECRQGTCTCKDDFYLDNNNSSNCIIRPINIGDRCQVHSVCQERFNFALCNNEQCKCITGYHFVNVTRSCVLNQALYSFCRNDYECYGMDYKSSDSLECKNGVCVCKEGEPQCAKGSLMTDARALVTVTFFLQRILHFLKN
ncbi:prion-like-(Q/N-rich) domain-bearing protein 25 isoform X2 [Pseudomyrmex gracilis]|uniref:prion-like-(Q/N-rich) domain-bearing protein 25 isoform X2 n=1 Tax=Pseudomyrmex gracilis TaxID=219809 RepID=UPI0009959E99|nr:prion-like-(Q/N-rich) domain-bearing protein 25 isoform X2 [Pseudomyrmex gracilis]